MKRIVLLFILSLFMHALFAHAGMYDRFLDIMVSYRAMFAVVLFTHFSCFVCVKYIKPTFVINLQARIITLIKYIRRSEIVKYISSWIFCSFVYGVYLVLISGQIFFWGLGILFLIFLIVMFLWTFRKKWREKFLWGPRVLFCYVQTSVFIVIGLFSYSILTQFSFFRSIFSYTDKEYQLQNFYLYPDFDAIFSLCENMFYCSILFIIPYLTFGTYRILHYSFFKLTK